MWAVESVSLVSIALRKGRRKVITLSAPALLNSGLMAAERPSISNPPLGIVWADTWAETSKI